MFKMCLRSYGSLSKGLGNNELKQESPCKSFAGHASPNLRERSFARQFCKGGRPVSQRTARRKQRMAQIVEAVAEAVELAARDAWVEKTLQLLDRRKVPNT